MIKIDTQKAAAIKSAAIRAERDRRIALTDWTQAPDVLALQSANQRTAWAKYRQALRDVTKQAGFPNSVQWPVSP